MWTASVLWHRLFPGQAEWWQVPAVAFPSVVGGRPPAPGALEPRGNLTTVPWNMICHCLRCLVASCAPCICAGRCSVSTTYRVESPSGRRLGLLVLFSCNVLLFCRDMDWRGIVEEGLSLDCRFRRQASGHGRDPRQLGHAEQ